MLTRVADQPRVFGHYVLLKPLGSGGTADVQLARPAQGITGIPSPVVIKRLHGQLAEKPDFVLRFQHEATIAVAIDSPHVAKVYDVGRVDDTFYIAMEYVSGWTLSRLYSELETNGAQASLESIADIIVGALAGLSALHTATNPHNGEPLGAIHRDIAPKNMIVGEDGVARLIDLGLGKSTLQDWKTGTGVVMGSPGYMSPEQVTGMDVDARTDIYAMGIVLWEFLTQRRLIKRAPLPIMLRAQAAPKIAPPSSFRDDVSPAVDAVTMRALAFEPQDRFETAADFMTALRDAIPERKSEGALATLVGDMLWGELGQEKTEVTKLLSRVAPTPMQIDKPAVEVFAQGTNVRVFDDPASGPQSPSPAPTPTHQPMVAPSPMTTPHAAAPTPTYANSGYSAVTQPKSGLSARAAVALMGMTGLLGVVGTLLFTRMNEPEPVPATTVVEHVEPPKQEQPKVTALQTDEPEEPTEAPAAEPEKKRRVRPKKKRPAETKTEPAPPPAAPAKPPSLNALLKRARTVQKAGHPDAKALVAKISMELTRPEVTDDRKRALAAEVRKLEKSAQ